MTSHNKDMRQDRQQQGRDDPGRLVRRQQADGHGRQPHGHQGRDQRRLASHPVSEMPEGQGADGLRGRVLAGPPGL